MTDPTNIKITATDATGPAFTSARQGLKGLAGEGGDAAAKLSAAGAAFVQSLERQAETIGKTRAEIASLKATQLGVAESAAPLIARLRAADQVIGKTGVSAAQTAAAMRTLPAQFTDIATSLAGGQSPFLVLLQQGGQIKDSFGGIGNAAKALGSLITPVGVAVAAVAAGLGALSYGFVQGAKEASAFNKALILTGGYAGASTSQLIDMSAAIGKGNGNQALAAEALEKLAASGRIASSEMQNIAAAAVAMARATGESVDDIVKDFVRLADEPTKASAKLNEQFHYLTASVYEQIAALEENGRKNEAAALAENTYANAIKDRAGSVVKNLGLIESAWNNVASASRRAINALLDIGRAESTSEKINGLQKQLDERTARGPLNSLTGAAFDKGNQALRDQIGLLQSSYIEERKFATQRGEYLQTQEASIKAQDRIKKQIEESATKQEKMNKALAEARRDFDAIRKADPNSALLKKEDQTYANIRDKFKEAKGAAPKAFQDDAATKMIERLREQNAAIQAQIESTDKLTGAEAERVKFNQQIADLQGKGQLTAQQKSLLASKDAILAQLDINVASEKALALIKKKAEEEEKHRRVLEQVAQLTEATNIRIEASLQGQREQYDRQLAVFGLGSQAAEQLQATKSIYKEFQTIQTEYTKSMAKQGMLGSEQYASESAKIKASLQEALDANTEYFRQLREKQGDWKNGATTALQDYVDEVNNASKRAQSLVAEGLGGFDDALTKAIMGDGGASFADVGKQIATQITKGIVQQQITKPLAEWLQGSLKDGDSVLGKGLAAIFGGGKDAGSPLGALLGNKSSTGSDPLGDFMAKLGLDGVGTASASASTSALATSATAAASAVSALASAAAAASTSMGGGAGSSIAGLLGSRAT